VSVPRPRPSQGPRAGSLPRTVAWQGQPGVSRRPRRPSQGPCRLSLPRRGTVARSGPREPSSAATFARSVPSDRSSSATSAGSARSAPPSAATFARSVPSDRSSSATSAGSARSAPPSAARRASARPKTASARGSAQRPAGRCGENSRRGRPAHETDKRKRRPLRGAVAAFYSEKKRLTRSLPPSSRRLPSSLSRGPAGARASA